MRQSLALRSLQRSVPCALPEMDPKVPSTNGLTVGVRGNASAFEVDAGVASRAGAEGLPTSVPVERSTREVVGVLNVFRALSKWGSGGEIRNWTGVNFCRLAWSARAISSSVGM
jgi:hypothetical protein